MVKKDEVVIGSKEERVLIEKTKKISIKEASAYSFMDGFGLRYVTPYALATGASNTQIALLSSVPGLVGSLSQLFTFRAMKKWPRKNIIRWSVFLQALMWIFMIAAGIPFFLWGMKTSFSSNAIVVIYILLILAGAFAGPAWSSLMRDLVSKNRGEYFGLRNRIAGTVALVCMFVAGFLLDYFKKTHVFLGFAVLFFVAFVGRFISSYLFTKHYDPKFTPDDKKYFTIFDFIKKMRYNNFGRFVLYFSTFSLAVAVASPFFSVFYLKNLGFSYTQYMITAIANSVSAIIFMPLWGKFADRYGNLKVMKINGFLIPFLPLFYLPIIFIHTSFWILFVVLLVEIYSGFIWAGFNLAAGNFIYDAVSRERLSICTSYFNILNAFGSLFGALLGGYLASQNFQFFGLTGLLFVFLIGGIARFAVHFIFFDGIEEVREVRGFSVRRHLKERTIRLYLETKRLFRSALRSVSMNKFFDAMVSESEHLYSSNPNNLLNNN
ncbi:Major Facilitator Superfamily protein [uncultured archaeon]|nr:Major Facilitator Superfamily protein [uncultured archaeon]